MTLKVIDHVQQGEDRSTSYFKTKKNYLALLKVFLEQLQEIEVAFHDLSKAKDLSQVTGIWLDYIGRIIGEERKGRGDEDYRAGLNLRIAVNTSDGTPPVIYEIVKTFTQSDKVRLAEGILSWGQVILNGTKTVNSNLYNLLEEIKPVTSAVLIMQDTDNKCFFPAWEYVKTSLDVFETFNGTVSETLELVLTEYATPIPLYVSQTGEQDSYDPDTIENSFLFWEEMSNLMLSDGTDLVLQVTPSTTTVLEVYGLEEQDRDSVLLPWEINETTKG